MKKRKLALNRILLALTLILAAAYVLHYIVVTFSSPVSTLILPAKATDVDSVNFEGFVIREEKLLPPGQGSRLIPLTEDGSRVGKNETVCVLCSSDESAADYTELLKAKEDYDRCIYFSDDGGTQELNLEKLNSNISDSFGELLGVIRSGRFEDIKSSKNEFISLASSKQILTGKEMNLSGRIEQLDEKIKTLSASVSYEERKAPFSGYYIGSADGVEEELEFKDAASLDCAKIRSLLGTEHNAPKNSAGKIVNGFKWYIAGILSIEDAQKYKVGRNVNATIPDVSAEPVSMTVEAVNAQENKKEAAVVFSCDLMNKKFANIRKTEVRLLSRQDTGYKLPKSVLHYKDSQPVVYVLKGKIVAEIPVTVEYSGKDYIIVNSLPEPPEPGSDATEQEKKEYKRLKDLNRFRAYDAVITRGRDLYDGKVFR